VHKLAETQSGVIKGKFGYMSPEQAVGEDVDSRTDIFSVGVLLYEMMTGRRLFHGRNDAESIEKVRAAKVPTPSLMRKGVPAGLDPIVFRALTRDRRERYADANAFQVDLSKFLFTHGSGTWTQQLAAYMRQLFGDPSEQSPQGEPVPKSPSRISAETDALIDDLIGGEASQPNSSSSPKSPHLSDAPLPKVSTQILNAQTDAVLGELGLSGEATETPLPPPGSYTNTGWTAKGRPIEKPPEAERGKSTAQVASLEAMGLYPALQPEKPVSSRAPLEPAAPLEQSAPRAAMREMPTARERPENVLGLPGISDGTGASPVIASAPARSGHGVWVVIVLLLIGLIGFGSWKTGLLSGEWRSQKKAAALAKATATQAAAKPQVVVRYGTVEIGASPENAKVFQFVGKTPVDLPHLDEAMTQELRFESDGFWVQPALAVPSLWKDDKAELKVSLAKTGSPKPVMPKVGSEGSSDKYGTLHITSTPEGADVWLLVGFTPTHHMEGVRADKDYRFKVVAEHHLPKVVDLKQADWKDDGMKISFRADLELPEDPKDPIPVIHVKQKQKSKTHTLKF
jgi:hypothetical protein